MHLLSHEVSGSGANFKKGRRADPGALGEREPLACQIGPKFKLCTRSTVMAQVAIWLDTVAAILNDRVDNRTAFSGVGVSEEQPVLLSKGGGPDRVFN